MDAERCVMCGKIIPEGRQVCPLCENSPPAPMNRKQRRDAERQKRKKGYNVLHNPPARQTKGDPDFAAVSLNTICQSIQLLMNELSSRGYKIYDFDHKDKAVQQIMIINNKVYFMAAKEGDGDGKL